MDLYCSVQLFHYFDLDLPYGDNISPLLFELTQENDNRLHVKIYDPNYKRWEVPERSGRSVRACSSRMNLSLKHPDV